MWIESVTEVASQLERVLFDEGYKVHVLDADAAPYQAELCRALNDAGVIAIHESNNDKARERTRRLVGEDNFVVIEAAEDGVTTEDAANRVREFLRQRGFLSDFDAG